jgi:hypothetical protein
MAARSKSEPVADWQSALPIRPVRPIRRGNARARLAAPRGPSSAVERKPELDKSDESTKMRPEFAG